MMEDAPLLEFLRARAPGARSITSVCTGALVLGAAGLLQGYRATTHWLSQDILALFGAETVNQSPSSFRSEPHYRWRCHCRHRLRVDSGRGIARKRRLADVRWCSNTTRLRHSVVGRRETSPASLVQAFDRRARGSSIESSIDRATRCEASWVGRSPRVSQKRYPVLNSALRSRRIEQHRVLHADRSGSSWPVTVETDAGVFYMKLRGAAQGPTNLVAEVVVGALADVLGLSVPTRVLIDILPGIPIDDPHQELGQLLRFRSVEISEFTITKLRASGTGDDLRVDQELASTIVWLDGLIQEEPQIVRVANPNLLWSHNQLWLVDHGAALGFQHDWPAVTEASPRSGRWSVTDHVLRSRASRVAAMDGSLAAPRVHRGALRSALDGVPDDFLVEDSGEALRRRRAAYVSSGSGLRALGRLCLVVRLTNICRQPVEARGDLLVARKR